MSSEKQLRKLRKRLHRAFDRWADVNGRIDAWQDQGDCLRKEFIQAERIVRQAMRSIATILETQG